MEVGEGVHSQTVVAVQLVDSVLLPLQNMTVVSNVVDSLLSPGSTLCILHSIRDLRLQFCTKLRVDVTHQFIDVCQVACINHRLAVLVGIYPHLESAVHRIGVFSAVKEFLVQVTAPRHIRIGIIFDLLKNSISLCYIITQECSIGFSVGCYIAVSTFRSQASSLKILRDVNLLFYSQRSAKILGYSIHEGFRCQRSRTDGGVFFCAIVRRVCDIGIAFDIFRKSYKTSVLDIVHSGSNPLTQCLGFFQRLAVYTQRRCIHGNSFVHVCCIIRQRETHLFLSVQPMFVLFKGIIDIFAILC